MNIVARSLLELQETTILASRALFGVVKRPRYIPETIAQMDAIGVGSLTIIILTGFFTGGVLTVQTFPTLKAYGAQDQTGYLVAVSLIRELGPVLCALMVTGRVGSAISAELGSMVVSQQIDAMRALGRPHRKLAPETAGFIDQPAAAGRNRRHHRHCRRLGNGTALYNILQHVCQLGARRMTTDDLIGGIVKPIFALIIGLSLSPGLATEGGTASAALRGP